MTDTTDGSPMPPVHPAMPDTRAATGPATTNTTTADSDSCTHPGIVVRPGPTGPRAALVDGPDVWEVIGALHALRDEDPTRHAKALRDELRAVTGLTTVQVAAALDYYTAHPKDVDTRIAGNHEVAERRTGGQPPGGPSNRDPGT